MKWPFISVLIINFNGMKWIKNCLTSVLSSDYPKNKFEVIFVDNGSSDESIEFVKRHFKDHRIKILHIKNNIGWALANNAGIKIVNSDIIISLSNDMEVDDRWLKEIVKVMKSDPKIGIVQCNSISMWDRITLDSGMNFLDKYGFAYSYVPQKTPSEVFFAEGMAFAIKRNVFEEIKGFDDYYFMEYSDMDLSWRARLRGYKVFFSPSSIVYHGRGGTVGGTYFDRRLENITDYVKNHLATIIKNYELKNLLEILPVVIGIQLVKIIYFLKVKNLNLSIATLKGILYVIKDLKIILEKRNSVQQKRKVSDKEIMKLMHPFKPGLIYSFIALQAKGIKQVLNDKLPMSD